MFVNNFVFYNDRYKLKAKEKFQTRFQISQILSHTSIKRV